VAYPRDVAGGIELAGAAPLDDGRRAVGVRAAGLACAAALNAGGAGRIASAGVRGGLSDTDAMLRLRVDDIRVPDTALGTIHCHSIQSRQTTTGSEQSLASLCMHTWRVLRTLDYLNVERTLGH
jgi:hypothetical protein